MNFITYPFLLLALSNSAHAEDTYNFYFQKAPGPVTVNQGTTGQTAPKDTLVNPVPPPIPATVAQAAQLEPLEENDTRLFELSFGIAGNSSTDKSSKYSTTYMSGQYFAGLQLNIARFIGLQGEVFYLTGKHADPGNNNAEMGGSRLDYSGAMVVTPFRINAGRDFRVSLSAVGGIMTVPHWGYDYTWGSGSMVINHYSTLFYGGRIGFEFWNRVSLQATIKRTVKFDSPSGTLAMAALF